MSLACNQNPQQDLDESEDIELMRVKLESLKGTLDELQDDGECHVFLGLHCIAMGIELGKKMT